MLTLNLLNLLNYIAFFLAINSFMVENWHSFLLTPLLLLVLLHHLWLIKSSLCHHPRIRLPSHLEAVDVIHRGVIRARSILEHSPLITMVQVPFILHSLDANYVKDGVTLFFIALIGLFTQQDLYLHI